MSLTNQADIDAVIAKAIATGKECYVWAVKPAGFGIRAKPSGSASYILQYRYAGKARKVTIGTVRGTSLHDARKAAEKYLAEKLCGGDPAGAKRVKRGEAKAKAKADEFTVAVAAPLWLADYSEKHKDSSLRLARTIIGRYIVPVLGKRPVADINQDDAVKVLKSVPKDAMRRNVYAYCRVFFEWTTGKGFTQSNPFADLPKTLRPSIPKRRHRYLDHDEVKAFWESTANEGDMFKAYFRLLLATGQRRQEVAGVAWRELDRPNRLWNLPASRAKNDQAHTVHLNEPAIQQLDLMAGGAQWPRKGLVFSSTGTTPVSGITKPKSRIESAMADELPDMMHWRTHDLRRTMATHCGELGEAETIIELGLNHIGGRAGLIGTYNRASRFPERKEMFEIWGAALLEIVAGHRPDDFRDEYGEVSPALWRGHCLNRRELWRQKWGEAARGGNVVPLRVAL